MVKYAEYKTFRNGHNTVVTGSGYEPEHVVNKMAQHVSALYGMVDQLDHFSSPIVKGIARLHPGDTYDEKTGVIVASRKCEVKAVRKTNAMLAHMADELEKLLALVKQEIKDNTAYEEAAEKRLKEIA